MDFFTSIKNRIFIIVFFLVLTSPWTFGAVFRIAAPETYQKLSAVDTEKREMAQVEWGNLINTGESISNFVDDRIPFRYTLISWYKGLNDAIEGKYQVIETAIGSHFYTPQKQNVIADKGEATVPKVSEEEVAAEVSETTENTEVTETTEAEEALPEDAVSDYFPLHVYQDVIIARDGWLFLYGENEIECYQGTNNLSEEEMQQYTNKLKQLQSICDAKGKELYIYIAPNKSSVYSKYMPTVDIVNSYRRIQQLYEYVNANCDTKFLYPLENELVAAGRYQVYYKYDSHWNRLGGLFGTNALYDAMGVEYVDPSNWITGTEDAAKYELYTYMGIPDSMVTHDDTECTVDYKPEITVSGLNTEAMINRTTSDGMIDKKLCLIGDSFRVNMMPYLSKDFKSCTFVHRDYMSETKSDIKNADVIVIEAVERYDYEAFNTVQRVINTLNN